MNDFFVLTAHNTLAAIFLALLVYAVTRVRRNPPVAHLLWLIVLLKLVAPPAMHVDWCAFLPSTATTAVESKNVPASTTEWRADHGGPPAVLLVNSHKEPRLPALTANVVRPSRATLIPVESSRPAATPRSSESALLHGSFVDALAFDWNRARLALLWIWIAGGLVFAGITAVRIVRFQRRLQDALPASARVQRIARQVADKIGVRRMPDIRYIDCVSGPFLWCAGRRPLLVLPTGLLQRLDDDQLSLILAHELAHLRRRDHWVRALELVVSVFYWWNPLVRAVRGKIHQAEDHCCDAWVRWAYPDCAKRYAEVVFQTAEFLDAPRAQRYLPLASPFLRPFSLKARIEMILENRFAPRPSRRSTLIVAALAILTLPAFFQLTRADAQTDSGEKPSASGAQSKSDSPGSPKVTEAPVSRDGNAPGDAVFAHAVYFEQGARQFLGGDNITITEVRGSAETFAPGNIYRIKGTYQLASHDKASLSAFTTAKHAADATGSTFKFQTAAISRGTGTFTLVLPTSCEGWPHISFYPAEGGESFGGNYFGTGESVLKKWWATAGGSAVKSAQQSAARASTTTAAGTSKAFRFPDSPTDADFSHAVHFEQGATQFLDGDNITITEVRGSAETFAPGNIYRIKGTYQLASHEKAGLSAFTTAKRAVDGTGSTFKFQSAAISRGIGTFTLVLPMSCEGWPHVSFYAGGGSFGGNYFGTDQTVLKKWWGTAGGSAVKSAQQSAAKSSTTPPAEISGSLSNSSVTPTAEKYMEVYIGNRNPTVSEFPYAVQFEQAATLFEDSDNITITEVRGTAGNFAVGHLYVVKGTYKLASHEKAMLSASITATKGPGIESGLKPQNIIVNRGSGHFALFLPMHYEGWPHVSFYPADGGDGFGWNYFGTGDSVKKGRVSNDGSHGLPIREMQALGGSIERDALPNGRVVGIDFANSHRIKDEDIRQLQSFISLQTVGLSHTGVTNAALAHLEQIENFKSLMQLSLQSYTKTETGFQAYNEYKPLTTLYIDNTQITDDGLKPLKNCSTLTTLGLGHTQITDTGLKTVHELTRLTTLYLDNTQITDAGLDEIGTLKELRTLGLGHTQTTDAGLKKLSNFTKLTTLYIDNTQITDAGLAELKNLKDLETLGLGHTRITDAGLKTLEQLKNLQTLYVDNTQTTIDALKSLREALPQVHIHR